MVLAGRAEIVEAEETLEDLLKLDDTADLETDAERGRKEADGAEEPPAGGSARCRAGIE